MTLETLHTETEGTRDKPQILLLHGWGSSAELMRPIADRLKDQFEFHIFDLPGHGKSPSPAKSMGVPESAEIVVAYIKKYMTAPVDIIGHSNGGRISLYLSATPEKQDLIKRLILISPSGVKRQRSLKFYVKKYLGKTLKFPFALLPLRFKEPGLARLRASLLWKSLGSSDYKALSGPMRETFVKTVNFYLEDLLPKVKASVLLLRGSEDDAISENQMRTMERLIPDAGYIELPGAGHFGYLQQPEIVSQAVVNFLGTQQK